jgi:hypothetical protein
MNKMSRLLRVMGLAAGLLLAQGAAAVGLDQLSNAEAGSGIREALMKGANYAVGSLGKQGGFLNNAKVKIGLPEPFSSVEPMMRTFGMGSYVDDFVNTMNTAAEQAVVEAMPVLGGAIKKMSLKDAKEVLSGGDDAATQYFRRTTSDELMTRFLPIVKKATGKTQLTEKYNALASKASGSGMLGKTDLSLDNYVAKKALDGLFVMFAEQEKQIRSNPLQAGSNLLQKVFGAIGQ